MYQWKWRVPASLFLLSFYSVFLFNSHWYGNTFGLTGAWVAIIVALVCWVVSGAFAGVQMSFDDYYELPRTAWLCYALSTLAIVLYVAMTHPALLRDVGGLVKFLLVVGLFAPPMGSGIFLILPTKLRSLT